MRSLLMDAEEMTSSLERFMQQTYIERHIEKPFIDRNKIIFLTDIYQHMNMSQDKKRQLLLPVMLVQCALDTHERIPSMNEPKLSNTEKQLSVLAGDYYSALYYSLLASNGHIDMIRLLASVIKEINEYKMTLLYGEAKNFNDLIYYFMKIESSLITSVAKTYQLDHGYIEVVEKACLINKLTTEAEVAKQYKWTFSTAFLERSYGEATDMDPVQFIEREIGDQKAELDHLLACLPHSFDSIRESTRQYFALVWKTTFAEEG